MGQASFGEPTEINETPVVATATPAAVPQVFVDEGARDAIQQLDGFLADFQKSAITDLKNIANNINEKTKVIDDLTASVAFLKQCGESHFENATQAEKDFEAFKKYAEYEISKASKEIEEHKHTAVPVEKAVVYVPKTPKAIWILVALNIILVTTILIRG